VRRPGSRWGRGLLAAVIIALSVFALSCEKKAPEGKTVLTFVTWKPNQPEVWDEILAAFSRENPDIDLRREVGPHSSTAFHDLLTQKLKNKSTDADVFLMDVIWPPEFAAAGWAMKLDDRLGEGERERYLKGPLLADTYQGSLYGLPLFVDGGMLYYRKDLLEKYGFEPPATWQELVEQARTIVRGEAGEDEGALYGYSGQFKQYEGLVCNMMEFIMSNRGTLFHRDTRKSGIDEPPALEAVRFVRKEIIGGVAPRGVLTYQEPESLDLFIQGKAVFHRNWPYAWEIANNPERSLVAGKVGITELPHFPGGKSFSTLGGWQVGISSYTEHPEAAWRFARYLSSPRVQRLLAVRAGLAPTRKALYDDPDVLGANPQFERMKGVFLAAYPRPRTPLYPAVSHVMQRYFSRAVSDPGVDIAKEAERAAAEINDIVSLSP
jgi:multiple sugar transport system substrate-binding protein